MRRIQFGNFGRFPPTSELKVPPALSKAEEKASPNDGFEGRNGLAEKSIAISKMTDPDELAIMARNNCHGGQECEKTREAVMARLRELANNGDERARFRLKELFFQRYHQSPAYLNAMGDLLMRAFGPGQQKY